MRHLTAGDPMRFQPSNITYGLFPPLGGDGRRIRKREKHERLAVRALDALEAWRPAWDEDLA